MQSKVKLTKRQVKEDKFTTMMLSSKSQFQENWQFFVIGIVVLLLIIAAVAYYFDKREDNRIAGLEKFSKAMLDYRNGSEQPAIIGFSQIMEDYGSSPIAAKSTFYLGNLYLTSRNYEESEKHYSLYLEKYHDDPFYRAAAEAGLAACSENQGDYSNAASHFLKALDENTSGPGEAEYHWGAFRNYILVGNPTSAEQQLNILKDSFSGSEQTNKAIRLFSEKGKN